MNNREIRDYRFKLLSISSDLKKLSFVENVSYKKSMEIHDLRTNIDKKYEFVTKLQIVMNNENKKVK